MTKGHPEKTHTHSIARLLRWCALYGDHGRLLGFLAFLGPGLQPVRLPLRHGVRALDNRGTVGSLRIFAYVRMGHCCKVGINFETTRKYEVLGIT